MPKDKLTDFPLPLDKVEEVFIEEAHKSEDSQMELSSNQMEKMPVAEVKVPVAEVEACKVAPLEFSSPLESRGTLLFIIVGGFFIANAIIAEFIGSKVFSLDQALGWEPHYINIAGKQIPLFNLTAGALLWPLEITISNTINEYFGRRSVRVLMYITITFISYAFLMVFTAIQLPPAEIWIIRIDRGKTINMEEAFEAIFSQGLWTIMGSLTAFLIGQLIDSSIFHRVKQYTGQKHLWLRNAGATVISQLVDSYIVLFISYYFNPHTNWDVKIILVMGGVKYSYKFFMVFALTPLIYLLHGIIDNYLGEPLASKMKEKAMQY